MDIDRVLDQISARHLGLLPTTELRAVGVDRHVVAAQERRGTVERLSPRVLRHTAVPVTDDQRVLAGCLDVAGGAVASDDTAAWLWRVPGFPLRDIEVTAKRVQRRTSSLAFVHRPSRYLDEHVTVVRGIEVTDLPWTLFSLLRHHLPLRVARAIDSVCVASPSTLLALHRLLPKVSGKGMTGCVALRELLDERPPGIRLPGSGAQRRFEEIMAGAGIVGLRREVDFGGHEWLGRADYRCDLTGAHFEVDSELHHTSPSDVAADALRDDRMIAAGATEVVRIPTELIWSNPAEVVRIVRSTRSRYLSGGQTYRSGPEKGLEAS